MNADYVHHARRMARLRRRDELVRRRAERQGDEPTNQTTRGEEPHEADRQGDERATYASDTYDEIGSLGSRSRPRRRATMVYADAAPGRTTA